MQDVSFITFSLKGLKIVKRIALVIGMTVASSLVYLSPVLAQPLTSNQRAIDNPVAATVDGKAILLSDVEDARNLLPNQFQGAPLQKIYPMLVETLINSRVAADMARRLGFAKTAAYKQRMDRISNQILERIMLTRHLEQKITEILVQDRYLKMVARAKTQKESHARHILVKSEDEAKSIIKKLEGGADFGDLAHEFSKGPSGAKGGDLGWFGPGRMVPQFDQAVSELSDGSYTKTPVQTQFGWHIIQVEERRPLPIKTFKEARPGLVNNLSAELGQKLMEKLRKDAKIVITPFEDLNKVR